MKLVFLCFTVINCVVSEITFGRVEPLLTLTEEFPSLSWPIIVSIQESWLEPNTLFISTNLSIFSARLLPEGRYQLGLIAGSVNESGYREGEGAHARFHKIRSSVQTEEGLIVTDAQNHCLRLVHPPSTLSTKWSTSTYAGRCQFRGYRNGRFLNARFSFPYELAKQDKTFFLSDFTNKKLRMLDRVRGEITTIHSSDNYNPFGLALSETGNGFFVGARHGILRISEGKESWLVGWSGKGIQKEKASFSRAKFSEVARVAWLDKDTLLTTDLETRTIKVVNLAKQEVDVICPSGNFIRTDEEIKSCPMYSTSSMLVTNNTILIGQADGAIKSLEYQISEEETTTARENSATFTHLKFCKNPPPVSQAKFNALESYPEGSAVFYQCIDNYIRSADSNNKLLCADVKGELYWIGTQIECLPSAQMVSACVLAAICVCTMISIVVAAVKLKAINKQLKEAANRPTHISMATTKFTTAGSEAGCSNKSFTSGERRDSCGIYRDPAQHISTSLPCHAAEATQSCQVPKPAPRRTRQTKTHYNC